MPTMDLSPLSERLQDSACSTLTALWAISILLTSSPMRGSVPASSKMIWSDKLPTSKRKSQEPKSSPTLPAVSTLSEKDLKPYWNEVCKVISSQLWLPTATDWHGSALTFSNGLLSATVAGS